MPGTDGILRFLACGSVDDGKSTLIGHLIHLTGNLYDDQLRVLEQESARIGTAGGRLDYSLLMDGLIAEREQGITIDVAYRYFSTHRRKFIVADAPGHEMYTRNMATGASQCTAALILLDAAQGVLPQTRRHALICSLMGIRRMLFAVNKMDKAGWSEKVFRDMAAMCRELADDLSRFGMPPADCAFVPVSALNGDNIVTLSRNMPWYTGATVLEWLHDIPGEDWRTDAPFRMPVQHVIKIARSCADWQHGVDEGIRQGGAGTFRAYAGTVSSGEISAGDSVVALPSGLKTTVTGIWNGGRSLDSASAGMAVALTIDGEHDIIRGDCLAHGGDRPGMSNLFKVRLVWMDEAPLHAGRQYLFRSVCGTAPAEVTRVRDRIDLGAYRLLASDHLSVNDIGEAEIMLSRRMVFDNYETNRETGSFILIDRVTNATAACGMILHPLRRADNVHWHREDVGREQRAAIKGQKPCVVWMTGLSGSGKSSIANCLERKLNAAGRHTMLLDGDNIRHGLNKNLGFTEADRIENIRRIGEVAKLMADAGLIVITAFISPFKADRDMARQLMAEGEFIEVYIGTPLEVCEERDPKGLYKKARSGAIPNFTGINSPYEPPQNPEITLDTLSAAPEEMAETILRYLETSGILF